MQAALDWRYYMVSGYEDTGQEKWLADRGIALVRGVAGPAWSTWTANGHRQNAVAFAARAGGDGTAMTVEDDRR